MQNVVTVIITLQELMTRQEAARASAAKGKKLIKPAAPAYEFPELDEFLVKGLEVSQMNIVAAGPNHDTMMCTFVLSEPVSPFDMMPFDMGGEGFEDGEDDDDDPSSGLRLR